ncbi:PIN domain-containing protein [Anabaena sp. UHCC 0451]|uniref:PIN domain-containing protein n=1 Tax=Anabaena sp. UHCC 0451 TaxID=2055235 RepID=UPI002B21332B|nr:PIN domain-containing protein [Anabaena sp. UHCC 0451]MEA5575113.1 PIN domain-containing protein [Anabaena sp. UHCC 0451]
MIRVYLDTSIYNRPFDDQTQPKIFLETQAVILILQMVEAKILELVSSSVLEYENSRNPVTINQQSMKRYLQLASLRVLVDENIRIRGKQLEKQGVKPIDALHVACAESSQSNYFITSDKRLINRCQDLSLQVINPTDLILEIEDDN